MWSTEIKIQVVLLLIAAGAFLVLAVWFFRHAPSGRWAVLGAVGAALLGVSLGIEAVSHFENVFLDSAHIAVNLLGREYVGTVLLVGRAAGAVVLALAVVESRRTAAAAADSIYGS